jgi:hypothetical protein
LKEEYLFPVIEDGAVEVAYVSHSMLETGEVSSSYTSAEAAEAASVSILDLTICMPGDVRWLAVRVDK